MLPVAFAFDQRGVLQHLQMPRNGRQRYLERLGEFADRRVAFGQTRDDGPAGRVGEGGERGIELYHLTNMLINMIVKCKRKNDPSRNQALGACECLATARASGSRFVLTEQGTMVWRT